MDMFSGLLPIFAGTEEEQSLLIFADARVVDFFKSLLTLEEKVLFVYFC